MDEAFLQLLGGTAVTGFGFLAYNHPREYRRLAPFLAAACFAVGALMYCWLLAVQRTELAVIPLVKEPNFGRLSAVVQDLKPSLWVIEGIGLAGPILFGLILPWIGTLKKHGEYPAD